MSTDQTFSLDRVAEILRDRYEIPAHVDMTGGGVSTLFAGETRDEPDWGPRYAALAGPGWFDACERPEGSPAVYTVAMASLADFCIGKDDDSQSDVDYCEDMVPSSAEEIAHGVAFRIATRVRITEAERAAAEGVRETLRGKGQPTMTAGALAALLAALPADLPVTIAGPDGGPEWLNVSGFWAPGEDEPSAVIGASDDFDTRQW